MPRTVRAVMSVNPLLPRSGIMGGAPPHDEAGDYSPYLTLAGKLRLQAEDTLRNSCFVDPNEGLVTSLVYSGGSEGYPNGLGIFRNPQISQSFFEMFRC